MGFNPGERVRMIGGRIVGTIVGKVETDQGSVYSVNFDEIDGAMELPADMLGDENAPIHQAVHKFIEQAKAKRQILVMVGKVQKGGFVRILAGSYEELSQKKKIYTKRSRKVKRNVTWKWLFELSAESTPSFIGKPDPSKAPPKPPKPPVGRPGATKRGPGGIKPPPPFRRRPK